MSTYSTERLREYKKKRKLLGIIARGSRKEQSQRWRNKYPERNKAHQAVYNAVLSGKIKKPDTCEKCNLKFESKLLHAHHEDYSQKLNILWLCHRCHNIIHGRRGGDLNGIRTATDQN